MSKLNNNALIMGLLACGLLFQQLAFSSPIEAGDRLVSLTTLPDYPPFCFLKAKKSPSIEERIKPGEDSNYLQGYSWDIVRESFHEQGYTILLNVRPWSRALKSVEMGSIDVLFPAGKNQERLSLYAYSQQPVNDVKFLVYINQDQSIEWQGLDSIKSKLIGVMSGYNYGNIWNKNKPKTFEVVNLKQGFDLLRLNRIKGFAGYEIPWDFYLKGSKEADLFKKLPPFDSTLEYVVTGINHPNKQQILKDYDQGYSNIKAKSVIKTIEAKWR
jgi:polar amino acid transport system substrate-binding protein